jgi:DNA-binding SARP family transcriptional activator
MRYGFLVDRLAIRLFGPPHVLRGDTELRFDTRKAVALIALLAVNGREQSREFLAAMLWPELNRERSRAALRRTLSVAAAAVPEIVADGQAVWIELGAAECDVVEFRRLIASEAPTDWAAAAEFVRGDFLDGFALRDSPAFEHWQFAVADALRDDTSLCFALLVDEAVDRGDLPTALGMARRRIEIDPLSEPAHVDLIRVTAWTGDRLGALQAYRELVRFLDRELGVPPLPSTAALYEAIRSGTLVAPPQAGSQNPPFFPATTRPDDVAHQVVEAAFVLRTADSDLIRSVAGRSEAETTEAIEAAITQGLLREGGGTRGIEATETVVVALHRSGLPLARLRLLHARAAEALVRRHAAEPTVFSADEIGRHFAEAGREDLAATWFTTAARDAMARSDHTGALSAWRSVIALGRDSVEVEIAIGISLARLGRYVETLVALGRADELASGNDSALDAAREALAIAERRGDPHGIAALHSHLSDLLHDAGRDDEARVEQQRWAATFAEAYGPGAVGVWTIEE